MNYIVLDLEWNQPTAGKNKEVKQLPFEIIEIGAVKLNDSFQMLDTFQSIVRPVVYPHLNRISQEITGFAPEELQGGPKFSKAFQNFIKWCGPEEFRFCTWGPLDLTELQRNMQHYGIPLFQAPVFFYDIQEIFSISCEDGISRRSLEYAVEFFHLQKQQDFHRALSDAYYTAQIISHMNKEDILQNYTIDTYQKPRSASEEVHITYDTHEKYVSRVFSSRSAALGNPEVSSMKCFKCQKRLRKKIYWFSDNSKNYYALAYCPEHGYITGKLRIKKTENDHCFVIKELRLSNQEEVTSIMEKREEHKRKKRLRNSQAKKTLMLILAFISVLTSLLSFSGPAYAEETSNTVTAWPSAPEVYGTASILIDADSGAVLYAKNADQKLYPASITKIMTGLLAIENLNMNDTITYTDDILNALPADAAKLGLTAGETTTIQDALYALMLRSANEIAIGLATKVSGSEAAFTELMNNRAQEAGALNTHFSNATGLHDESHYTTAYDMAMIAKSAMSNSEFSVIWGTENYTLAATNVSEAYRIWNRHPLLLTTSEYYYSYAVGGKTGYTDEAGRTLVTAAEKDGLTLICVIMQSDVDHIYSDTESLFEYGFTNFRKVNIATEETRFGSGGGSIPVIEKLYGTSSDIFSLSNTSITIPNHVSLSEIPYTIEFLEHPEQNVIAYITYEYNGNYLGKASLMMNLSKQITTGPQKQDTVQNSGSSIKETTSINIYLLVGSIIGGILLIFILIRVYSYQRKIRERKKRRNYYK